MKKRTTIIGALVSLLPLGQPMVVGIGAVLTSSAVMLVTPEKPQAESYDFYVNLGLDKYDAGDYHGAIGAYNKAIKINPKHAYAYFNRGMAHAKIGDVDNACSDWIKASSLGYKSYPHLAKACKREGH